LLEEGEARVARVEQRAARELAQAQHQCDPRTPRRVRVEVCWMPLSACATEGGFLLHGLVEVSLQEGGGCAARPRRSRSAPHEWRAAGGELRPRDHVWLAAQAFNVAAWVGSAWSGSRERPEGGVHGERERESSERDASAGSVRETRRGWRARKGSGWYGRCMAYVLRCTRGTGTRGRRRSDSASCRPVPSRGGQSWRTWSRCCETPNERTLTQHVTMRAAAQKIK
jgi:hypothetical protein